MEKNQDKVISSGVWRWQEHARTVQKRIGERPLKLLILYLVDEQLILLAA